MKKRELWQSFGLCFVLFSTGLAGLSFAEVKTSSGALPAIKAEALDLDRFSQDAVTQLSAYLKIDTVNPPGNETRGVEFLAAVLEAADIEYETAESAPGRGNLWAKLPATTSPKKADLVLLHHIDVVPANRDYWSFDPLSGEVKAGYIYGRGAIDTKGLGIAQLQAFLALKASGLPRNRDVWLVATADEEAGGFYGAGWMVKNRPEVFENVGYLLNEGGSGRVFGETVAVMVEVTQKVPLWLRLTARGQPGHGSAPLVETSVTKLIRALKRIAETEFPVRVLPPVAEMFEGIAPFQAGSDRQQFANIGQVQSAHKFLHELKLKNPGAHALLRNTCSITRLEGSAKINVIPAEVNAELDCRLLPDQDVEVFLADLKTIINDDQITVQKLMNFTPAVSKTQTPLFKVIQEVSAELYDAQVVPTVSGGFTDSHFFRDLGITSYGYSPFAFTVAEFSGVHGNDERISVENVVNGVKVYYRLLTKFVGEP